ALLRDVCWLLVGVSLVRSCFRSACAPRWRVGCGPSMSCCLCLRRMDGSAMAYGWLGYGVQGVARLWRMFSAYGVWMARLWRMVGACGVWLAPMAYGWRLWRAGCGSCGRSTA